MRHCSLWAFFRVLGLRMRAEQQQEHRTYWRNVECRWRGGRKPRARRIHRHGWQSKSRGNDCRWWKFRPGWFARHRRSEPRRFHQCRRFPHGGIESGRFPRHRWLSHGRIDSSWFAQYRRRRNGWSDSSWYACERRLPDRGNEPGWFLQHRWRHNRWSDSGWYARERRLRDRWSGLGRRGYRWQHKCWRQREQRRNFRDRRCRRHRYGRHDFGNWRRIGRPGHLRQRDDSIYERHHF